MIFFFWRKQQKKFKKNCSSWRAILNTHTHTHRVLDKEENTTTQAQQQNISLHHLNAIKKFFSFYAVLKKGQTCTYRLKINTRNLMFALFIDFQFSL